MDGDAALGQLAEQVVILAGLSGFIIRVAEHWGGQRQHRKPHQAEPEPEPNNPFDNLPPDQVLCRFDKFTTARCFPDRRRAVRR